MLSAELEQARQQVALLTEFVQFVLDQHMAEPLFFSGLCVQCGDYWPCAERIEADRVLLAVSAVGAVESS